MTKGVDSQTKETIIDTSKAIRHLIQRLGDTMSNLINPPKAKRPSKKVIVRQIMEMNTPTGGDFDAVSLERTNITNLILIRDILLGGAK